MPRRRNSYQPSLKTPEKEEDSLIIASSEDETPLKQLKLSVDKHENTASDVIDVATPTVPKATSGLRGRGKGRLVRSEKHVSEDDEEETVQQDVVAIAPTNVPQILQLSPTAGNSENEATSQQSEVTDDQSFDLKFSEVIGGHSSDLKLTQQQQNLSLEALCQAAKSELQIISKERGQVHPSTQEVVAGADGDGSASNVVESGANVVVERQPGEGDVFHLVPISTAEGGDAWMLKSAGPGSKPQVKVISNLGNSSLEESRSLSVEGGANASFEYGTDEESMVPPQHSGGRRRKHPQKPGKYICSYCGRGCAKPSVLEKHIRAHTGERPYPCVTCGFSFKTKSNLYKHRKSRAHQVKAGVVPGNSSSIDSLLTSMDSEDPEQDDRSVDLEQGEPITKPAVSKPARFLLPSGSFILPEIAPKSQLTTGASSVIGGKPELRRVIVLTSSQAAPAIQTAPAILQKPVFITPQASQEEMMSSPHETLSSPPQSNPVMAQPPQIRVIAPSPTVTQHQQPMFQIVQVTSQTSEEDSKQIINPAEANKSIIVPTASAIYTSAPAKTSEYKQESQSYKSVVEKVGDKSMKLTFELPKPEQQDEPSSMTSEILLPPAVSKVGFPRTPLGSPSVVNLPKLPAPAKNLTSDELKDRISYLISTNQAIVNTPMAEPPRPKRMMRQRSEIIEGSKSDAVSGSQSRNAKTSIETENGNTLSVKEKISRASSVDVAQLRKMAREREPGLEDNGEELVSIIPLSEVQKISLVSDNVKPGPLSSPGYQISIANQDGNDISLNLESMSHSPQTLENTDTSRKEVTMLEEETALPQRDIIRISDEDSASSPQPFESAEHSILTGHDMVESGAETKESHDQEIDYVSKGEPVHIFLESHDALDQGEFTEEGKSFACLECQLMFNSLKEVMSHLVEVCPAVHNAQVIPSNHKIHVFSEDHQSVLSVVVKKIQDKADQDEKEGSGKLQRTKAESSEEVVPAQDDPVAINERKAREISVELENDDMVTDQPGNSEDFVLWKLDDRNSTGSLVDDATSNSVQVSSSLSSASTSKAGPYRNVVLELVDPTAPLKRGRPRGSKNRPKTSQSYESALSIETGVETAYVGSWKTPPVGAPSFSFPLNVPKKTGSFDEPVSQVQDVEVVQYPVTEGMFRGYRSAMPRRSNSQGKNVLSLNITPHGGGLMVDTTKQAEEEDAEQEKAGVTVLTVPGSGIAGQSSGNSSSLLSVPEIVVDQQQIQMQQSSAFAPKDDTKRRLQSHILMKRSLSAEKQVSEAQKIQQIGNSTVVAPVKLVPKTNENVSQNLQRSQSMKPLRNQKVKDIMRLTKSLEEVQQPKRPRLKRQASVFDVSEGTMSTSTAQGSGDLDFILQKLNLTSSHQKSKTGLPHTVTNLKLNKDVKVLRCKHWNLKQAKLSGNLDIQQSDSAESSKLDKENTSEVPVSKAAGSVEDANILLNIIGLKRLDKILPNLTTLPMNELMLVDHLSNLTESPCCKIPKNCSQNLQVLDLPKQLAKKIPGFLMLNGQNEMDEPVSKKSRLSEAFAEDERNSACRETSVDATINKEIGKQIIVEQKLGDSAKEDNMMEVSGNSEMNKDSADVVDVSSGNKEKMENKEASQVKDGEVSDKKGNNDSEKEDIKVSKNIEKYSNDNKESMELDREDKVKKQKVFETDGKQKSFEEDDTNEEDVLTIETDEVSMKMSVSLSQGITQLQPMTLTLSDGSYISTAIAKNVTDDEYSKLPGLKKSISDILKSDSCRVPQRLQDKPSLVHLYLGHSYPVLDSQTHCTLCSLTKTQPLYAKLTDNNKVSMYSTWRAAASNHNTDGLSTTDTLNLYKTGKVSTNELSNALSMTAESEATILTESSEWDGKKEAVISPSDSTVGDNFEKWNAGDNRGMLKRGCISVEKVFMKTEKTTPVKSEKSQMTFMMKSHDSQSEGMVKEEFSSSARPVTLDTIQQKDIVTATKVGVVLSHSNSSDKQTDSQDTEYTLKQITYTPGEKQYLVWSGQVMQKEKRHHLSAHGMQGFKSEDQYEYVRGRGRGKYVCQECGIRCKKPSMLRKHFRTHTDLRPYHCKYCNFAFKTKGNLTKHMKSKAHHRKCVSLGLSPIPTYIDDSCILSKEQMAKLNIAPGDEDTNSREQTLVIDGTLTSGHPETLRHIGSSVEEEDDDSESDEEEEEVEEEQVSMDNMVVISDGGTEHSEKTSHLVGEDTGLVRIENTETGEPMLMRIVPGNDGKTRSEIVHVLKDVPVVDKEAADSLLELARREVKNAIAGSQLTGREDSKTSGERLGRMIGALLKRTNKDSDTSQMLKNPAIEVIKKPPTSSDHLVSRSLVQSGSGFIPPSLSEQTSPDSHTPKLPLVVKLPPGHYNVEETVRLLSQLLKGIIEEGQQVVIRGLEATSQQPVSSSSNQIELVRTSLVSSVSTDQTNKVQTTSVTTGHHHNIPLVVSTESNRSEPLYAGQRSSPSTSVLYSKTQTQENTTRVRPPKLTILQRQAVVERQMKLRNQQEEDARVPLSKAASHDQPGVAIKPPLVISSSYSVDDSNKLNNVTTKSGIVTTTMSLQSYLETLQKQEKDKNDEATKQKTSSKMGSCLSIMPIPGKVHESVEMSRVEGKYTCSICGKAFQEGALLQQHLRVHAFEHTHRCSDCSLSFKSLEALEKHLRSENHDSVVSVKKKLGVSQSTDPRPFKCDDCNIAFRNHGHLLKHLRSKSHVMQLEGLGKLPAGTFLELEKLGTQLNSSDADTFLRDVRGFIERGVINVSDTNSAGSVTSSSGLESQPVVLPTDTGMDTQPMLLPTVSVPREPGTSAMTGIQLQHIDTGELKSTSLSVRKEPKFILPSTDKVAATPHKCGICGRAFEQIVLLREHLASHAELRPYVCEFCDAGFTTAKSLQTHLKSHTPSKKKYICGDCGEVFTEVVDLVNHSSKACKASHLPDHQSTMVIPSPQRTENQSTLVIPQPDNEAPVISPPVHKTENQPLLIISSSHRTENQPKLIFSQPQKLEHQPTVILPKPQMKTEHQPTYIIHQPHSTENQPTLVIPPSHLLPRSQFSAQSSSPQHSSGNQSTPSSFMGNKLNEVTTTLSSSESSMSRPSFTSPQISALSGSSGSSTLQSLPSTLAESSNIQVIPVDGNSVQMRQILQKQEDGSEKPVKVMVINWDSLQSNQ